MNTTRTWTHAVITAAFAITAAGMSFSVVLAEPKKDDAPTEKSCFDKLHAAGMACAKNYRGCIAEHTTDAQLYCDTKKETCETRAQNANRACEKAIVMPKSRLPFNPNTPGVERPPLVPTDKGEFGGTKGGYVAP